MKTRIAVLCLMVIVVKTGKAQSSEDIINYINSYKEIAINEMQRTGVPASITLAQGIHETLAGTSDLVRQSNNHFGIKCKEGWTGSVFYHDDDSRGECFRGYDSPLDSYKDHSDFLKNSPRYSFLFRLDPLDYEGWANGLRRAGYATNRRYSEILIRLIKDFNLQQYSLLAAGKIRYPIESNPSPIQQDPPFEDVQKNYPQDAFFINRSKVIFAKGGTSLLALADQYAVSLSRLLDFNDLSQKLDVLEKDQLVFLQRKRRLGGTDFHIVQRGETIYDISQSEGIRCESLLALNQLFNGEQPAAGEKLFLQSPAPSKPQLLTKN
jgi:hypothetical protein